MGTDRRIGPPWVKPAVCALAVVAVGGGTVGVAFDTHAFSAADVMWRPDYPDLAGAAVRSLRPAHPWVWLTANVQAGVRP